MTDEQHDTVKIHNIYCMQVCAWCACVLCTMEKSIPNMLSSCFLQNLHEFRDIFTFCRRFFLFRLFFYRAYRRPWKNINPPRHVGASEKDGNSVYTIICIYTWYTLYLCRWMFHAEHKTHRSIFHALMLLPLKAESGTQYEHIANRRIHTHTHTCGTDTITFDEGVPVYGYIHENAGSWTCFRNEYVYMCVYEQRVFGVYLYTHRYRRD